MTGRRQRWGGGVAAAVVLVTAGIWNGSSTLLLAATVPLAYLAYGAVSTARVPEELALSRTVEPSPAPPGRPVEVTLTVTNGSDRTLSDVRVVDGVPADLAVLSGSPRAGTTLGPGESVEMTYTLVARRGDHDFGPPRVRVRGTGGGAVATMERPAAGATGLVCRLDADAPPLDDRGARRVGQLASDDPGDGVTFHSTREYESTDPAARIDWRHYAKRGELATVNYDRPVSTTVVLVLDARSPCHVAAGPGRPTAAELGAYAATRALSTLLRGGHDVGVAVVGREGDGPAGLYWLPPGGDHEQRARATDLFRAASEARDGDGDATDTDADDGVQFRKVAELAPTRAQLVLVSPALDDGTVGALETWAAFDRPRTLLSPDVVPANTVSGRLESVQRRTRLARCRATGARTIDWRRGTPLPVVLAEAFAVEARASVGGAR
jgi:uncharacterized repeat protein (TIGR01451 family)